VGVGGEGVFVVGLADASKEEKWPQSADPGVITYRTTDRQHNWIAYCLLQLYRQM